jgi:hypothetical protein
VFLFLFCCFLLRCHVLFSLSILHGLYNGRLLQLIECIESKKSDVKKKMMRSGTRDPHTKVTCALWRRKYSSTTEGVIVVHPEKLRYCTSCRLSAAPRVRAPAVIAFWFISPSRPGLASIIAVTKSPQEHMNGCLG